MKRIFPAASLADATTSICCCRSKRTRKAPAEMVASQSALMFSANNSIAVSASSSNSALYESVRRRAITGRKTSLSGHKASTTCQPDKCCGLTESSGLPSTFSAYVLNKSKFFTGKPLGFGCGLRDSQFNAGRASHLFTGVRHD